MCTWNGMVRFQVTIVTQKDVEVLFGHVNISEQPLSMHNVRVPRHLNLDMQKERVKIDWWAVVV